MYSADDHRFMTRALQLAALGLNTTTPNPRVGCVVVRDGVIVGEGWHRRTGEPHAEVHALREAGQVASGATVYVTLEPCSHFGRTPPCADMLVVAGVSRVVAAMQDPNPVVGGRGLSQLREAGIQVECGLMEVQARTLNVGFVSRMTRNRPWVRMKIAASLDGKTALNNGASQWITGADARRDGHRWRARSCAVLTGIGSVLSDNPQLNVRDIETIRQPLRVVVDSKLQIPLDAKVLADGNVLVATAENDAAKSEALTGRGVKVVVLPNQQGKVDLAKLMSALADYGINEVLVEAGEKLNGSLLDAGLVDELIIYLAPHLLGSNAQGMFNLPELSSLQDKKELRIRDLNLIGGDIRILAEVVN